MELNKIIAKRANKDIYVDGDKVIKVFSSEFKDSDVLNEALNHARAVETGLNVPSIFNVSKLEDNRWAITMQYIEGITLDKLMEENPDKLNEYLERFVELQTVVHGKKSPLMTKLKDKMTRKIDETKYDATTRYELKMRLNSMPRHNKLCHGDFKPSNIIIAKDGWYIIDWSHATQGNASADAARTYLLFVLEYGKEIADKYMALFCKQSDTARQYVEKWLPIVAASQSVKGLSSELEFLEQWVNVVEYE